MIRKKILGAMIVAALPVNIAIAAAMSPWKFTIAPYVWGMNMSGDVQIAPQNMHINESFSDIIKDFHGGGMLWLDATNDRYGLFFNSMYAVLDKKMDVEGFSLKSVARFGLFTLGGSYRVYETRYNRANFFAVEPYIGARYTLNDASIDVISPSLSASNNVNWTDPIIGARLLYNINKHWSTKFAADIGGTNFNNHKSYNLNALIGYNPSNSSELFNIYLGYRLLYQHYETGSGASLFVWKMHLFGPVLGFAFTF